MLESLSYTRSIYRQLTLQQPKHVGSLNSEFSFIIILLSTDNRNLF